MRSLLLFIGSVLYPLIMAIISPLYLFLYFLLGSVMLSRYVKAKTQWIISVITATKIPSLQEGMKKQFLLRTKAVRLH